MSIIQGSAHTSTGGYQIERSLRFNSADSANLSRTPASAGNRRTWTWSAWVKRTGTGNGELFNCYIGSGSSNDEYFGLSFSSNRIIGELYSAQMFSSVALYRDHSAWYHIVFALDTTLATADNRARLYVNGVEVGFDTRNNPTQNAQLGINQAAGHAIGRQVGFSNYFNGYITEVNFIDGQQLTPSSFGETDAITGVWKPKAYSGTYGTNGFFLKFADNSGTTSTTLGKDSSGNGNNWTPNNFSVTAGAGNDSLVDTPTNYGTDTGAGGTVRGNYCTLNPLQNGGVTLTNGNLDGTSASGWITTYATIGISTGKWYWEGTCTRSSANEALMGIVKAGATLSGYVGSDANGWCYYTSASSSLKINNASSSAYGATYTTGDVIGVALDLDVGTLVFYKNGVSQGTAYSSLSGQFFPAISVISNSAWVMNFGQRAFAYTAPSGFKALCTQNLPTPAVVQGDDYFNTVTFTGNSTSDRTITTGLQSDFVWTKRRNDAYGHLLFDAIRGAGRTLRSQDSAAESNDGGFYVQQFNSTNFLIGGTDNALNHSSGTYVAWVWNAGGSNATNTSGSITSTVRASTTAGFSVVTYTGTGANATVGHGLGVAPSMIIIKGRSTAYDWRVYHTSVGNTSAVFLNTTAASAASSTYWNNTSPTSTVFSLGTNAGMNESAGTYVAYCFAPVAGYSAFGSYTGNGSTDGPFVYTGFRPRWIMIKRTDSTGNWQIQDTARTPYNWTCAALFADLTSAEVTGEVEATYGRDYLSNGFKIRASHTSHNASGGTYVYMAFAENPFKHSLAR